MSGIAVKEAVTTLMFFLYLTIDVIFTLHNSLAHYYHTPYAFSPSIPLAHIYIVQSLALCNPEIGKFGRILPHHPDTRSVA